MAYFKLSLLTPRYKNNDIFFLKDVITEWDSPIRTYENTLLSESPLINTHSLTYNEKFSKHRNGQKDLTFSMNQMIIRQDEWFENPFCRLITNGTQLLLEDQYNKQYLFTVVNIKFNIKENNIIYDVTCQDSFSYQLSRQNNGYTIENDSSSADFIGARTLDWWVTQKIAKECYLYNYQYIPLFKGLYTKTSGDISLPYDTLSANDVKEIIKEIYKPAEYDTDGIITKNNDQDYYETIPFSCSGSSALNALISLAEELNMQVVVFEHLNEDFSLARYFWFEPQKNDKRIGLTYSPNRNIQNFGLTHKGESLTTILNVNGTTYDDELITLIPSIPSFWGTYINSAEWKNSNYTPGMFSSLCSSKTTIIQITDAESFTPSGDMIYIELTEDVLGEKYSLLHQVYYNKFNLWSDKIPSTIVSASYKYTAQHSLFQLVRTIGNVRTIYNENTILPSFEEGESWAVCVQPVDNSETFASATLYLTTYRDTTEDERNFAAIADECPWLENKLINFKYFYDNNIISKKEYEEISNKVTNELRKINGELLWYSQAHYNAIHRQTKIIADLTNKLDLLGATFQSDFVSPLENYGSISADIDRFTNAYNDVFSGQKHNIEEKTLINLDSIKEEYVTKYFNAQQRFLKNIYNFRDFFYQNNGLYGTDLYEHKLTLTNNSYGFDILKLNLITSSFDLYDAATGKPFVNIYQQKDNQIIPVEVAYNGRQMYYAESLGSATAASVYSKENTYEYRKNSDVVQFSTYADIVKHYLKVRIADSHDRLSNYYYYSKEPIYTYIPQMGETSGLGKCITYLKQDILLSSLNSFGRNLTGPVTEAMLWEYLPVNSLYVQEPNYSIVHKKRETDTSTATETLNNDKKEYYYWYIKNKKQESIKTYVDYVVNQNKNTNKDPQELIPVINPYLDEFNYLPLDFVTPDNEGLKYRLVNGTYAPQSWTYWAAGFLAPFTAGLAWLLVLCKQYWTKDWATQGGPDFDVMGNTKDDLNEIPYYATDSNWLDSYEQYKASLNEVNISESGSINIDWNEVEPYLKGGIYSLTLNNSHFDYEAFDGAEDGKFIYYTKWNKWSYNYKKAYNLANIRSIDVYYLSNNYKILNYDSKLKVGHNYYMCCVGDDTSSIFNNDRDIQYFMDIDDVMYYPFTTRFVKLNNIVSKYNNMTLEDVLKDLYGSSAVDARFPVIRIHKDDEYIKVVFYEQFTHAKKTLTADAIDSLDVEKDIYEYSTDKLAVFDSKVTFWNNIYELGNDVVWHETNVLSDNITYYYQPNFNSRLYRIDNEIKPLPNTSPLINGYYINATEKTELLFTDSLSSYMVSVYKYDFTNRTSETIAKNLLLKSTDFVVPGGSQNPYYVIDNDCSIEWEATKKDEISTRTNGEFWYNYKNSSHPILQQQALAIETQLTQYWSAAYVASKYCEYFIPENWFSQKPGTIDYFNICIPTEQTVELNSTYVPVVSMLRDENNSTLLPRYSFKKSLLPKNSIFSKEEEFKDKINYVSASTLNNIAIRNALYNIGEDTESWLFEENGRTSYYYVEDAAKGSGYTWTNFIKTYNQQFNDFSGLYIMFYKLIASYTNQDESRYYELKQMHDDFWSQLYHDYGYLLLENVYTNENATNSLDLLKMAKLYFKDLNTPERQYNITVIDTASLDNYQGEEIRIGDGIKVNAQEFYNEYDVIYQSLSQYLFISDISYSLRQVTNINLTVNDIKYSDKMIQRLAKLIK